ILGGKEVEVGLVGVGGARALAAPRRVGRALEAGALGNRVHLMLAHVLVGAGAKNGKQARVVPREVRHHLVKGARGEQLPGLGKAHHPLRHVDAVAKDVHLRVDVPDQPDRPRLIPMRAERMSGGSEAMFLRTAIPTERASSGSPRKAIAAPSPVSSTMKSRGGTGSRARARSSLNICFVCCWSPTERFE